MSIQNAAFATDVKKADQQDDYGDGGRNTL